MKLAWAAAVLIAPLVCAQSLTGTWDATVKASGVDVPCRFDIAQTEDAIRGTFFNGEELYPSTSGKFENGVLTLNFEYTANKLEASFKDGKLQGTYFSTRGNYGFSAVPHVTPPPPSPNPPKIAGNYEFAVKSGKGEEAQQFIVRQNGAEVLASILRIDGDTGTLSGVWRDGKFTLSHFSGSRPALVVVTPQPDGSLRLLMNGRTEYLALKPEVARARGLPPPTDPTQHTSINDPAEPFHFQFKDLSGHVVSDKDPRFKGKVVVVNILGSWCPNCHDEAPFLEAMYKKYHARGLEVVALDFEDSSEFQDPARMRAFAKRYGIEYTILVAGETGQVNQLLPQMKNFNSWPTTFFLGKDGRVAHVHAGFPSSASGEKYTEAKQEFSQVAERLLSADAGSK